MKRALAILLVLVAMISAVFAMGGKESGSVNESGYKDTIKIAIGADVTSFDPHIGKETPAVAVTNHIYDTLVRVDPVTDEVVPQIAESWEIVSATEYRFHIRQGIKFHNGEDLTADDVKYSLDRAIASAAVSYIVDFIDEVIIEDDYTVLVTLDAPYAPALRNLAVPFAAIVPMDYTSANEDILRTAPVGSGPYKFESWSQNDSTKLVANEEYYDGAPATKYLEFRVVPEAAQRTIALETGEVDLAYDPLTADKQRIRENDDLVRCLHGAHPMGDDQNRLSCKQAGESFLYLCLILHIQTCRSFVKEKDRRVLQESPCDGDTLALAAGEPGAVLADRRIIALWKMPDKLFTVGSLGRGKYFRVRSAPFSQTYIFHDSIIKEDHILEYHGVIGKEHLRIYF